jgi:hypothetical protein
LILDSCNAGWKSGGEYGVSQTADRQIMATLVAEQSESSIAEWRTTQKKDIESSFQRAVETGKRSG